MVVNMTLAQRRKDEELREENNKKIIEYHDRLLEAIILSNRPLTSEENIMKTLTILASEQTKKDYQELINSPLTPFTIEYVREKHEKAKQDAIVIAGILSPIIMYNISKTKQIKDELLTMSDVNSSKLKNEYKSKTKTKNYGKSPYNFHNRLARTVLALTNDNDLVKDLKRIDNITRHLSKDHKNKTQAEEVNDANIMAEKLTGKALFIDKEWHWSTLENTRHEHMDAEKTSIDKLFTVSNSQTGEVDYLAYPCDFSNAQGVSNVINCGCWLTYNTNPDLRGMLVSH